MELRQWANERRDRDEEKILDCLAEWDKKHNVNTRDNKGFSAFHLANSKHHTEIVSMLQKKKKEIEDALPSLNI